MGTVKIEKNHIIAEIRVDWRQSALLWRRNHPKAGRRALRDAMHAAGHPEVTLALAKSFLCPKQPKPVQERDRLLRSGKWRPGSRDVCLACDIPIGPNGRCRCS